MAWIEVASFGVTTKTQTYGVLDRIWPTISFLNDVMDVHTAPPKLVAYATSTMRFNEGLIANLTWKGHAGPRRLFVTFYVQ